MGSIVNYVFHALLKSQRISHAGMPKSLVVQGGLNYVESTLVQLALVRQTRPLHSICGGCRKTKLQVSSSAQVPCRYVRKLYPDIIGAHMIDRTRPDENMELQLDYTPVLGNKGPELVEKIENVCVRQDMGRLFAVVYVNKEQRKITTEDILVINGFFPPQIGDRIRLEKVLMVGSKDFTLTGTPLLSKNLVKVEATVVEKTLSNIRVNFVKWKKFQRFKLEQNAQSMIVINSIELDPHALQKQESVFQDSSTG